MSGAGARPGIARGRVVSIDILRGLAILWVITFHIWVDLTLATVAHGPSYFYSNVRVAALEGRFGTAVIDAGQLVLSQGQIGVAVFMMLSGLSLTLNAYRRREAGILSGYATRFRRILPVYWFGVLLVPATIATIALLQKLLDGGSYRYQWFNVRVGLFDRIHFVWPKLFEAMGVFTWLFRDRSAVVPASVGSLWFIPLLLSYYLIFPFALMALKKVGPLWFALGGIALTFAIRAVYIPMNWQDDFYFTRYMMALAPFRASEFFIGMSVGALLATRRDEIAEWVRSPFDAAGIVLLGLLLAGGGVLLEPKGDMQLAASEIMIELGVAALMLPLLFKEPGRLEVSVPARALVFLGVVSLTALIVSDAMRYVASFLRYEDVPRLAWWFFLWAVYVPVGTLIAYPLASLFRLLPSQRVRAAPTPAPAEAVAVGPTRRQRKQARREERRGVAGVRQ